MAYKKLYLLCDINLLSNFPYVSLYKYVVKVLLLGKIKHTDYRLEKKTGKELLTTNIIIQDWVMGSGGWLLLNEKKSITEELCWAKIILFHIFFGQFDFWSKLNEVLFLDNHPTFA